MKRKLILLGISFTILLGITICGVEFPQVYQAKAAPEWSQPSAGQEVTFPWSKPFNLSNTETSSDYPAIVADAAGTVHVVWTETYEDGKSFFVYTSLKNGSWSSPNEILTSPSQMVVGPPSLAVDTNGVLHLVWSGDATILYSTAFATEASSAMSWSPPQGLEFVQNNIGNPHLMIDSEDVFHLAYTIDIGDNSGVYYLTSKDHGYSWSDAIRVYKNSQTNQAISKARIAVGKDHRIFIVWAQSNYPETYPATGIRLAITRDNGDTWNAPINIADGPYTDPVIFVRQNQEIHIVYSGSQPDRFKFHLWSKDGGNTWSPTMRFSGLGGLHGYSTMLEDSENNMHWLLVSSVFSIGNDSLLALHWQEDGWSPEERLLLNSTSLNNLQNVSAAIANGNSLYMVVQYPLTSSLSPIGYQTDILMVQTNLGTQTINNINYPPKKDIQEPNVPKETFVVPPTTSTTASPFPRERENNSMIQTPVLFGAGLAIAFLFIFIFVYLLSKRK